MFEPRHKSSAFSIPGIPRIPPGTRVPGYPGTGYGYASKPPVPRQPQRSFSFWGAPRLDVRSTS
eukprot:1194529-Rhodomonas_salina.1